MYLPIYIPGYLTHGNNTSIDYFELLILLEGYCCPDGTWPDVDGLVH